jgi:tetratricopeptide (TPR) repeat protein
MEWAIEFVSSIDKSESKFIRDTLEAKVRSEAGEFGEAARILWEVLLQAKHSKNAKWECITMVHMGKVYRAIRWDICLMLFKDAISYADEIGFELPKMMALSQLGELECQWGHFDKAIELCEKALSLVAKDDTQNRRFILLVMSISYEGLNELEKCRELLEEIVSIDEATNGPELQEDIDHLERLDRAISDRG